MLFVVGLVGVSFIFYLSTRLSMRFYRRLTEAKCPRAGAVIGSILFCLIIFCCGTAATASLLGVSGLYGCSYF